MAPNIWREDEADSRNSISESRPNSPSPDAPLWRRSEGLKLEIKTEPEDVESQPRVWRQNEGLASSASRTVADQPPDSIWDVSTERLRAGAEGSPSNGQSNPQPRSPKRRRRRLKPLITILLIGGLAAMIGDIAYAVTGIADSLRDVRNNLRSARIAIDEGQFDEAAVHLDDAQNEARDAAGLSKHLGFRALSILPDGRAADHLVRAAGLTVEAGASALEAAQRLGIKDAAGPVETLYRDGVVDFQVLAEAGPSLTRTQRILEAAKGELESSPRPLLDVISDGMSEAYNELRDAGSAAGSAVALFNRLPSLLGNEDDRRYLLAFQALGEARATGGFIGFFGVLKAEEGRLKLVHIGHTREIGYDVGPVDAPAWFSESYGPQSALHDLRQANVSPNFPVVSDVLLNIYETATGQRLDGVLAMDPVTLAQLMPATGPIDVGERHVTAENVTDMLMHDAYLEFPTAAGQEQFFRRLIRAFWARVHEGDVDSAAFASGLAESVRTQHLKVYSRETSDQLALHEIEADGAYLAKNARPQMIFHNNYGLNKADFFLKRSQNTTVTLTEDGEANVRTKVILKNEAPPGPPSSLLGEGEFSTPGTNVMTLNFLLPKGSEVEGFTLDGESLEGVPIYRDAGFPVVWGVIEIPPGTTARATLEYTFESVLVRGSSAEMNLSFFPQARTTPDKFRVKVVPPPGFSLRRTDQLFAPAIDSYQTSELLDEELVLSLELIPTS